jgi:hypothetical protein
VTHPRRGRCRNAGERGREREILLGEGAAGFVVLVWLVTPSHHHHHHHHHQKPESDPESDPDHQGGLGRRAVGRAVGFGGLLFYTLPKLLS